MNTKKILSLLMVLCFAALVFSGCTTAAPAAGTEGATGSMTSSLIMIALIFVVFYFFMIRPEKKKKKQAQEMRDSLEVGDKIITIGGMVGRVVHVSDDKLTFETGEDRVRIEVTKWAISTNEGKGKDKEAVESGDSIQ